MSNGHPHAGRIWDEQYGRREREAESRARVGRNRSPEALRRRLTRSWHTMPNTKLITIRNNAEHRGDYRTALRAEEELARRWDWVRETLEWASRGGAE